MSHKFSIIIPVFNRPREIDELLETLTKQSYSNFEVLVVEDGSTQSCKNIVEKFTDQLNIHYYFKENSGQGFSRNYGFKRATGDFFIIFDSDVLVPPHYLQVVNQHIDQQRLDAFGGPDKEHPQFNALQKAISYAMTSTFTTGGIRGGKKKLGEFHPRSFNMGISSKVFEKTGGFLITRMAEDLEFSIRIIKAGFKVGLIHDAYVYHKRRTNFKQFFKQLHFFGRGRVNLRKYYPGELKLVHTFPAFYLLGIVILLIFWISKVWISTVVAALYLFYFLILFLDSFIRFRNLKISGLSVIAANIQLIAYGMGFLSEVTSIFFKKR